MDDGSRVCIIEVYHDGIFDFCYFLGEKKFVIVTPCFDFLTALGISGEVNFRFRGFFLSGSFSFSSTKTTSSIVSVSDSDDLF